MEVREQVDRLLGAGAVEELHSLTWGKPKVNRGEYDPGWSCREHAVAVAALASLAGHIARVRHGRCMFAQGASGDYPPVIKGQDSSSPSGHSWTWIDGFGNLDASPRLRERDRQWRPLDTDFGIVGTTWPVRGLHTRVFFGTKRQNYENAIALATHFPDAGAAIYCLEREDDFRPDMLTDGANYINSPLTSRIIENAGPNAYVKMIVHIRRVLSGERRSLATVSFWRAWRFIGEISDEEAEDLAQSLKRLTVA